MLDVLDVIAGLALALVIVSLALVWALRNAHKAFLRPVSWRVSPEAEVELKATAATSHAASTQSKLMGLPYEVDRTLNGSLVELVTDPPSPGVSLADLRAMEAMRDAVERRP